MHVVLVYSVLKFEAFTVRKKKKKKKKLWGGFGDVRVNLLE